jgi:hypothetical protein
MDNNLAANVLRALANAYPQPVHFGYLGLALGVSGGAMWRVLRELRRDALISVDRSLAGSEVPFAQTCITGKGLAVADGIAQASDDDAATLRKLEALTLDRLQQSRERKPAARVMPGGTLATAVPERHTGAAAP